MKASLGGIIVNVALIHVAGLVLLGQPMPGGAQPQAPRHPPVQVRLAQADLPPADAQAMDDQATQLPLTSPQDKRPAPEAVTPQASPSTAPPTAQPEEATPPGTADQQAVTEEYIPRPRLSTVPLTTRPVIVPFPAQFDGTGRFTSVLALYIDEDGVVRRVRFDDAPLPASMKDAARQAFLQAHFKPGQVKGQAVKSMIRIEIVFDNTPITPDTSYTTL